VERRMSMPRDYRATVPAILNSPVTLPMIISFRPDPEKFREIERRVIRLERLLFERSVLKTRQQQSEGGIPEFAIP